MSAEKKKPKAPSKFLQPGSILAALGLILLFNFFFSGSLKSQIPYSEFLHLVESGKVQHLVLGETAITGERTDGDKPLPFSTVTVKNDKLIEQLAQNGIDFKSEAKSPLLDWFLSWILPFLVLYAIWSYLFGRMTASAQGGLFSLSKSKARIHLERDIKTTFRDVAGIDEAKAELQEAVEFLQNPTKFTRLGGRLPKGILLMGPPGTGKTLLARAVAGEAKVPFFSINGSEFVELFVGLGAARVRDLFEQARKNAPCIIFIDEIDALGKSRALGVAGTGGHEEKEQTLNQLLAEMDGFDSSEGVIMLAATNRPEILDPALLRAGRFDRQVLLTNPDRAGRLEILNVHAKKIKLDPHLNLDHIAAFTPGFSGADLENLVNEAALVATRRNAKHVTEADFSVAVERIVAGLEKKTRVMNGEEKQRIAFHELGHATVALALESIDKVHKVSIIPRGVGALGYTMQRPSEDRYVLSDDELLDKIAVLLGGRAAESIFLDHISTGAADDLAKATNLARAMITQFGMSERLGLATYAEVSAPLLSAHHDQHITTISERTASEIDAETKNTLERAFHRAYKCLEKNRLFMTEAHAKLMKLETLNEDELLKLWRKSGHTYHEPPPPQSETLTNIHF